MTQEPDFQRPDRIVVHHALLRSFNGQLESGLHPVTFP